MNSNELHTGKKLYENLRKKICLHCGSHNITPFFAVEQEVHPPGEYWHTLIVLCTDCRRGQLERTYCDITNGEDNFEQTELYALDEISMTRLREFVENKNDYNTFGKDYSPCPEPLSPKCLCSVHWVLSEASKRLETPGDTELLEQKGSVAATFLFTREGFPMFLRSH